MVNFLGGGGGRRDTVPGMRGDNSFLIFYPFFTVFDSGTQAAAVVRSLVEFRRYPLSILYFCFSFTLSLLRPV